MKDIYCFVEMNRQTEIDKYTTGPWTNLFLDDQKHCWAKLFKKAQFLRSLLSKRVLLLFEIKWSVSSYYEQALIQECKSNEDCYQGSGVVIKMRTIHWDLYYISHACPHIYRTSTTIPTYAYSYSSYCCLLKAPWKMSPLWWGSIWTTITIKMSLNEECMTSLVSFVNLGHFSYYIYN